MSADRAQPPDARGREADRRSTVLLEPLGQAIGHARYLVLVPAVAVLLVALSLFAFGTYQALADLWRAWGAAIGGTPDMSKLTISFLKTVVVMLEAVVMFLVGVGLYSLFVAPLNIAVALGIDTLGDLEDRIVGLVITLLGVTFLENFIQWREPRQTLQFGAALALAVVALVLAQRHLHRTKEDRLRHESGELQRSRRDMFQQREEHFEVDADAAPAGEVERPERR